MVASNPSPGLADLMDLEFHLLRLEDGNEGAAAAARTVGESAGRDASPTEGNTPTARWAIASQWLQKLRRSGAPMPGARVEMGLRLAGLLLSLLGAFLGAAACAGALAYDGQEPINLWKFLGVFVLLQVLLLVLLLVALTTATLRGSAWLSLVQRGLRAFARSRLVDRLLGLAPNHEGRNPVQEWTADSQRLRARHALYHDAERWLLLRLAQRFGVYFNLGALLMFAGLVVFTDLAFGWSTTPAGLEGDHLAAICRGLGVPWEWSGLDLVPALEQVEATRWSRLEGAFADPETGPAAAAGWWPFLLMALLVWGLLPRLLAWIYARRRYRACLAQARLDHAGFARLWQLAAPQAGLQWAGPAPDEVAGPRLAKQGALPASVLGDAVDVAAANACVIVWGGWPVDDSEVLALLQRNGSWSAPSCTRAGGADENATRTALETLAAQTPPAVALLVEAAESPDKRLLRFLREMRAALRTETPILIALVEPVAGQREAVLPRHVELWQRYLAALNDPYLLVEALQG